MRTPAVPQVVQAPGRATFTSTKVPRFDGTASWEQYRQVFDAIVRSNGWDNDTTALQLFSHLEGGALTVGEDPAIFATALETLAVKAFGDMGQTARLRLIRDRFIAGHSSCELCRHLDSVPPETPIRDMVDRCRVWESHADPAVRRVSKPSTDLTYPTYVVGDADRNSENTRVAAVTGQRSGTTQLEDLLRRFLTPVESPALTGDGDTESSTSGYESSSADRVRADDALISLGTTPTTATVTATATLPTGLERRGLFLLREVGACSNTLPELE